VILNAFFCAFESFLSFVSVCGTQPFNRLLPIHPLAGAPALMPARSAQLWETNALPAKTWILFVKNQSPFSMATRAALVVPIKKETESTSRDRDVANLKQSPSHLPALRVSLLSDQTRF